MAADRVPVVGEVWIFRPYRAISSCRRGRVVILDVTDTDVVRFRYVGSGAEGTPVPLAAFWRTYDFLAVDVDTADAEFGPQLRPGERRLIDMPIRLGTAVD